VVELQIRFEHEFYQDYQSTEKGSKGAAIKDVPYIKDIYTSPHVPFRRDPLPKKDIP